MLRILSLLSLLSLVSCEPVNRYFGLQDDNPIEEEIEQIIESEIHVPIDLTPSSPE